MACVPFLVWHPVARTRKYCISLIIVNIKTYNTKNLITSLFIQTLIHMST